MPIIWFLCNLTNKNVTFIYSVTICEQKTYIPLFIVIFCHTRKNNKAKKEDRQEDQNQSYTCPADRRGLDHDQVNNFHLLSYLLPLMCCLVLSILYYMYIQGNTTHNRQRADECVKCFLKAFKTSRSRSFNKTESHTQTVKLLSGELSVF